MCLNIILESILCTWIQSVLCKPYSDYCKVWQSSMYCDTSIYLYIFWQLTTNHGFWLKIFFSKANDWFCEIVQYRRKIFHFCEKSTFVIYRKDLCCKSCVFCTVSYTYGKCVSLTMNLRVYPDLKNIFLHIS